jgi:multidrug efflux pump subunit AcrB
MWLLHFNLETITLLALALVVGVIVDDAIVAVENIVRHLEAGQDAARSGLCREQRDRLTLVAASLTIVAVFLADRLDARNARSVLPRVRHHGVGGVLFSLLAARTLSPTLAARWLRPRKRPATGRPTSIARAPALAIGARSCGRSAPRARSIAMAMAAFAAGLGLIPFIPKGFIPHLDRGDVHRELSDAARNEPGRHDCGRKAARDSIRKDPAVTDVYTTIGSAARPIQRRDDRRSARACAQGEDARRRGRRRARACPLDGVVTTVADVPFVGSDTRKPLQFALVRQRPRPAAHARAQFEHRCRTRQGLSRRHARAGSPTARLLCDRARRRKARRPITADLAPNLQIGDANDRSRRRSRKYLPKDIALNFGGNSADVVTTFRDFGSRWPFGRRDLRRAGRPLPQLARSARHQRLAAALDRGGAVRALDHARGFRFDLADGRDFLVRLVNKNAILLVDRINKLRAARLHRAATRSWKPARSACGRSS